MWSRSSIGLPDGKLVVEGLCSVHECSGHPRNRGGCAIVRKPRPRAGLSSGSSRFEKEPEPLKKAAADLEPTDGNKRMPGCQLFELIVPAEDGGAIGAAVAIVRRWSPPTLARTASTKIPKRISDLPRWGNKRLPTDTADDIRRAIVAEAPYATVKVGEYLDRTAQGDRIVHARCNQGGGKFTERGTPTPATHARSTREEVGTFVRQVGMRSCVR